MYTHTLGFERQVGLQLDDLDSLAALLKETHIITTQTNLLKHSCLRDFTIAPLPFNLEKRKIALFWHARYHNSARHQYWRQLAFEQTEME